MIWSAEDGRVVHRLHNHLGKYTAIAFAPDSQSIIAGDDAHEIHIIDIHFGKKLRSFGIANVNGISALAVSPDSKWLATASPKDSFLRTWNLEKGTQSARSIIQRRRP